MLTVLKVIGMIILVIVVLYLLMIMPRMINRPDFTPFQGRLYAHRGLHDNETNRTGKFPECFSKSSGCRIRDRTGCAVDQGWDHGRMP